MEMETMVYSTGNYIISVFKPSVFRRDWMCTHNSYRIISLIALMTNGTSTRMASQYG
jgi:hypothetical protein